MKSSSEKYEVSLVEVESKKLRHVVPNATTIDSLANWLEKGKLNLVPEYQRGYVWKGDKASRLVVTALCGRIIPAITMHEVKPGKNDVVDGKQRLSTLLGFYVTGSNPDLYARLCKEGKLPEGVDELSNLDEDYAALNGLTYGQLSEDRRSALSDFSIPVVKIPNETPRDDVFNVYKDINSGGEDLTKQQVRRAAYFGDYIRLLDEVVYNKDFQRIRDPEKFNKDAYELCIKDSDREMVLRAMAWDRNGFKNPVRPMKKFLNREISHYCKMEKRERKEELEKKEAKV